MSPPSAGPAVLGVSCDYHDAAAAVCIGGEIVAAAAGERFSRVKHDAQLPVEAIASCLAIAGIGPDDLDVVVFHEKPLDVVGRYLGSRRDAGRPSLGGLARDLPALVGRNLMVGDRIDRALRSLGATRSPELAFSEHHLSHAAAAFLPSPFDAAAILTVDGVGERITTTIGRGAGAATVRLEEQRFPHSLGLLYTLITRWCGFEPNEGEYKLMGLAPYGRPRFLDAIERLAERHAEGGVTIDAAAVGWWSGDPGRFDDLVRAFEGPPRSPGDPVTDREADLAASAQRFLEGALMDLARRAWLLTGERNLCLAGGVALNCVAVGRLADAGPFEEVWVQPAAGDAGSAIGAALAWTAQHEPGALVRSSAGAERGPMSAGCFGPSFSSDEVAAWLDAEGIAYDRFSGSADRAAKVAELIASGAVVGWFEGSMEFGPRALGHRSILADPRAIETQAVLNATVKGREDFRPFAPSVPIEAASDWFDLPCPSPYMLRTAQVAARHLVPVTDEPAAIADRVRVARSAIPACTHVDGSARVQTVDPADHPAFHELLVAFGERTGCPVLLNTSFNVAGEPIACTPSDAVDTARRARLDHLVIEDLLIGSQALAGTGARAGSGEPADPSPRASLSPWAQVPLLGHGGARRPGGIGAAMATVVAAVVVLPLWLALLVGGKLRRSRARADRGAPPLVRRGDELRVDGRMWAPDTTQDRPSLLGRWRRGRHGPPPAAMAGVEWWDDYQDLIRWYQMDGFDTLRFRRLADVASPLINVREGRRSTWRPSPTDAPRRTVWCYGGSALFGFGQRDDQTIASELAKLAASDGILLDVVNNGASGDTLWTEGQRFAWDAAVGPRPDLVLFYDGFNEVLATLNERDAGRGGAGEPVDITMGDLSRGMDRFRRAFLVLDGLGPPPGARLVAPVTAAPTDDPDVLATWAARRYEACRSITAALAEAQAIPIAWFCQPTRLTRRPADGEPAAEEPHEGWSRRIARGFRERLAPEVVDLGSVLDDLPAVFYDDVHHNERAAAAVAAAIYAHVRPILEARPEVSP